MRPGNSLLRTELDIFEMRTHPSGMQREGCGAICIRWSVIALRELQAKETFVNSSLTTQK